MRDIAIFGPGGNCEEFYNHGYKSSLKIPQWLFNNGLSAYEYQCGKGVKISEDSAVLLGREAEKFGIALSVHAPYYISLSSIEEEKRQKSVEYILTTLFIAKKMGAKRIVVHSGSCGKITRLEALNLAKDTLKKALIEADKKGYSDIFICPETMGKVNQLGNVSEVAELCSIDERLIPTADFGHINSQTIGGLKTISDYEKVFDIFKNKLGEYRTKNMHIHYSRIEYTNQGEKKHHTFAEKEFEPEFSPIGEIIAKRGYTPVVICESAGTQTMDSIELKKIYESFK